MNTAIVTKTGSGI